MRGQKGESRSSHLKISFAIFRMNAMPTTMNITPANAEMNSHSAQNIAPKMTIMTIKVIILRPPFNPSFIIECEKDENYLM